MSLERLNGRFSVLEGIVGSMSDWHLGNNGAADNSYETGILELIDHFIAVRVNHIVLCGDILEGWQFSYRAIAEAKRVFFQKVNDKLEESHPTIHVIAGNHDSDNVLVTKILQEGMRDLEVKAEGEALFANDWLFLHGHQWDAMNSGGFKQKFAHGVTWIGGLIERAIPGIDIDKLNPESWVSPAHNLNTSMRGDISDNIISDANKLNLKICYGHTHEPDIARNQRVANTGCCVDKTASGIVIFPDGNINLVRV